MPGYRSASGVVVNLPDDDTAAKLLPAGWKRADSAGRGKPTDVPVEAENSTADASVKRKPGRPKKADQE